MKEQTFDLTQEHEVEPIWRHYHGKRAIIHALEGSYASKRAAELLQQAERIIEELEKLLVPTETQRKALVDIYITDPVAEGYINESGNGRHAEPRDAVVCIVRPEDPGASLSLSLTRLLAVRWLGEQALLASTLLNGIAGVVTTRVGGGRTMQEITQAVQAKLSAGVFVSIFSSAQISEDGSPAREKVVTSDMATSFVAFLIDTFGAEKLHQYLANYDPERRDQAAQLTYNRPLGALEEQWRASLQRRPGSGGALELFFRRLMPFLKPYMWRQIEVLVYVTVGITYNIVLPLSGKYLIDTVIPQKDIRGLLLFLGILLLLFVVNAFLGMRRSQVNAFIVQHMQIDLQGQVFAHLQKLSHDFYSGAKVGDLMSRTSSDLDLVQQAWSQVTGPGLFMLFNVITAAVVLVLLSPLIGLLTLVVIPLLIISFMTLRTRFSKASATQQKVIGELATATQENISAHAVIKAFGLEQNSIIAYHARLLLLLKAAVHLKVLGAMLETSIALATSIGQLLILGIGSYLVLQGNFTVGTMLAAWGLLPSLFFPVATLAGVLRTVQTASGAMERIVELLDRKVDIADKPEAPALRQATRAIRLENVNFSYGKGQTILSDLNLEVPVGTHVAIVGPSGSGKSSIVNLLMRFWDPQHGRILFDDQDLRDVTFASLRDQIGLVFQDTFIFDTTVRENIAIGRLDATDSEIIAAARGAQLDSYIATLPTGFDTVLGERGVRMSGGQRQRLAIARVLLRNPRILILDEATSALDSQTEREILTTLNTITQGRTTISITHRLSIAASADYIVVLNQGQLVEQGTHRELVNAGGLYQQLYEDQTGVTSSETRAPRSIDVARLNRIPLFTGMERELLYKLASQLTKERFATGEEVVRQHEPGDKLYIIQRGQAEVLLHAEGSEQHINMLNENDYFGEMALLSNEPRTATVRTTMATEFYSLAQEDFLSLVNHDPQFRATILKKVTERQRALNAVYSSQLKK